MSIGIGIGLFLRSSAVIAAATGALWFNDTSLEADSTLPTMLAQYDNDRYAVNGVEKTFHELHTFTRSTTKWVVGEAGTLIEVAIDEPAFDYSSGTREFLEEDQGQNLLGFSEDFTQSVWTISDLTVIPNNAVAPDGTSTMDTLVPAVTSSSTHYAFSTSTTNITVGNTYTQSAFVRANGYDFVFITPSTGFNAGNTDYIYFDLINGVVGSQLGTFVDVGISEVSTGVYRIWVTMVSDVTAPAGRMLIRVADADYGARNPTFTGDGSSGCDVWGMDLKLGGLTSYIPTPTASSEIRAADNCKIDGTNFSDFWNAAIGTVYMKQRITSSSGYPELLKASDGGVSNRIIYGGTPALGSQLTVDDGGVRQVQTSPAGTIVGALHKEMFAYELNNTNIAFDGVSSTNDTSCTIPTVTQLDIFKGAVNGGIREIRYYPVRVTDSEMARITWSSPPAALFDLDFANNVYSGGDIAFDAPYYSDATKLLLQNTNYTPTYVEKADGSVSAYGSTRLRRSDKGLFVEQQRTIITLYNRDLTNAVWVKTNITPVKDQVGADGVSNSASSITATANNATVLQTITSTSRERIQSVYVKRLVGAGSLEMTMDGGTTWMTLTVGTSLDRVEIPTQTLANPEVGFRIAVSGDSFVIDFVQNEAGNTISTPMLTTSSSALHWADYNVAGTYSSVESPMLAQTKLGYGFYIEISTARLEGFGVLVSDGHVTCGVAVDGTVNVGNTFSSHVSTPAGEYNRGVENINKIAGFQNADGTAAVSCNGNPAVTGSCDTPSAAMTHWNILTNGSGGANGHGVVRSFKMFDNAVLSALDVQKMTE